MKSLRDNGHRIIITGAQLCRTSMSRGRVIDSEDGVIRCACADDASSKISQEIHIGVQRSIE
jgi:hypothetical protein